MEEYTFKADGEMVTVTLDELKKSYGLQKKLTRKYQELAELERYLISLQGYDNKGDKKDPIVYEESINLRTFYTDKYGDMEVK